MSKAFKPDISEDVIASICCRQAMADVSHEMIEHRDCMANVAGLRSEEGAFWERLSSVSSGKRARVDGPKEIRASMQVALPDFLFEEKFGDEVRFTKPLTKDVVLSITFVRINFHGLGKAYRVGFRVGRVGEDATVRRWLEQDVFELFGNAAPIRPALVYQTAEDLQDSLAGVYEVLAKTIPVVEGKLRHYLAGRLDTIPPEITVHNGLSARAAWEATKLVLGSQIDDFQAFGVALRTDPLHQRFEGPAIGLDGALLAHGAWLVRFVNISDRQQVLDVEVPYASSPQIRRFDWRSDPRPVPLSDKWLDSDRAVALAEQLGGKVFRESGQRLSWGLDLRQTDSGPVWCIHYWAVLESGARGDFSVQIDAVSGEVLAAGTPR